MDHIDAVLAAWGLKAGTGGAAVSLFGYVISSAAAAWAGALIAFIGLIVTCYFGYRRDRREQAEHEARMRGLQ